MGNAAVFGGRGGAQSRPKATLGELQLLSEAEVDILAFGVCPSQSLWANQRVRLGDQCCSENYKSHSAAAL